MLAHDFTIIFEPAEEGGFTAYVPEVPGAVSEGETLEEAREMVLDAMREVLAYRVRRDDSGGLLQGRRALGGSGAERRGSSIGSSLGEAKDAITEALELYFEDEPDVPVIEIESATVGQVHVKVA